MLNLFVISKNNAEFEEISGDSSTCVGQSDRTSSGIAEYYNTLGETVE
jgi:hypothetical protein